MYDNTAFDFILKRDVYNELTYKSNFVIAIRRKAEKQPRRTFTPRNHTYYQ